MEKVINRFNFRIGKHIISVVVKIVNYDRYIKDIGGKPLY